MFKRMTTDGFIFIVEVSKDKLVYRQCALILKIFNAISISRESEIIPLKFLMLEIHASKELGFNFLSKKCLFSFAENVHHSQIFRLILWQFDLEFENFFGQLCRVYQL